MGTWVPSKNHQLTASHLSNILTNPLSIYCILTCTFVFPCCPQRPESTCGHLLSVNVFFFRESGCGDEKCVIPRTNHLLLYFYITNYFLSIALASVSVHTNHLSLSVIPDPIQTSGLYYGNATHCITNSSAGWKWCVTLYDKLGWFIEHEISLNPHRESHTRYVLG